jgi:hypothetical protein
MMIPLLAAYSVIALLVASHSIVRMASDRPRRRRYHDRADGVLLLVVALAASAAWALLLPIYGVAWLGSRRGRELRGSLVRSIRLRPEPLFRNRLYQTPR